MMKKTDIKTKLVAMKVTELQKVKGGYREIPQEALVQIKLNRWEELEIRFGGHGGTKNRVTGKNKNLSILNPK